MADDLYYDVDFNPQIKKDKQSYQDLLSSTVSQSEVKEYKSKIRPPSISQSFFDPRAAMMENNFRVQSA